MLFAGIELANRHDGTFGCGSAWLRGGALRRLVCSITTAHSVVSPADAVGSGAYFYGMDAITMARRVAALVGNPARANMFTALLDGRALTAKELAFAGGVAPQTASGHLAG